MRPAEGRRTVPRDGDAVTAFLLILAPQFLDSLGLLAALPYGTELNPLYAILGLWPLLAAKMLVAVGVGIAVARRVPSGAPLIGLVGCAGCLTELFAVAGGIA